MYYIPEISPLLDRTKYETKIAFILPFLLDEARKKHGGSVAHCITLKAYVNGAEEPMVIPLRFEDVRGNRNYSFTLNTEIEQRGVDPTALGFFSIESAPEATFPLPSVLKTIGHWVAYLNDETYVVTPSNVQYASARLDYGTAGALKILDYFGQVETNSTMDTHLVLINPYVGATDTTTTFFDQGGTMMIEERALAPFSAEWIRLGDVTAKHGIKAFRGNVKMLASHRIVPFAFLWSRARELYYSMDHTISWVNRKTI